MFLKALRKKGLADLVLRTEAEELAIALERGFASVNDVIDWADQQIVALDSPAYELIELSLAGRLSPPDVAHLLRAIPGTADVASASRGVIARMLSELTAGRVTCEDVACALDCMQVAEQVPEMANAQSEMARIKDAFDLAHEGTYGTREQAVGELREFLQRCVDDGVEEH